MDFWSIFNEIVFIDTHICHYHVLKNVREENEQNPH